MIADIYIYIYKQYKDRKDTTKVRGDCKLLPFSV